ncbi:hypothetical protein LJK87_04340 [Paenibacillus sp. P25]|nr:hypothetical protein LJK87_04340 [Paenibacillus sp. P25]
MRGLQGIRQKVTPYIWYLLGVCALGGLFAGIYSLSAGRDIATAGEGSHPSQDQVKHVPDARSYNVTDASQSEGVSAASDASAPISIAKSKMSRGLQITLKQARILEQYKAAGGSKMVYLVQRSGQQGEEPWSKLDLVSADPVTQTVVQSPVGATSGIPPELAGRASKLCGFLNADELVYTTVRKQEEELVYEVNRYRLSTHAVTPMLELLRIPKGSGRYPEIWDAQVSSDGRYLLVRDSKHGLAVYDLATGAATLEVPGTAEKRSGESFQLDPASGMGLYSPGRFQNDVWWLDLNSVTARRPFTAEQGLIEAGMDSGRKLIYYNFTYDRSQENIIAGDRRSLLASYGVQPLDLRGNPLKRFSLPKDSNERLEFGGYDEEKRTVLLHKFTVASGSKGPYKKTAGWLAGDLANGSMTPLSPVDVPDGWDKKDMMFGGVLTDAWNEAPGEQAFVSTRDRTYYLTHWKTKQAVLDPGEDRVLFADEPGKRLFVSSLTRPDLLVAALSYKKYNWDNRDFVWLSGHYVSRYQP